ncbi:tRNA N6-adenosine(37)-N6-threonylcarbamoyltransferase complex dimerization subunit TsaB [Methylobacillus sp. MM3]|jgi:tRNA threonylcarbamoyladenosine biosynthesis protein TsaB|uniref:tRNA (adenosine(37)-N6)-threonylcarbamoyltransferase complex dimerization subunit type 1 TsaB n=1 Tax=Methylobacillus sp. MM3 TaxID=1848039 RepID=UPI0007E145BC|nr:tRNA (adenosine(37)-N6)-threonylcarbamoyltransferase complex dimerization subunit type 1 TsaB [Methylobacillus sp. MM3]OAJ69440.1 tRNA N6-adenosine(37)-N6-threonylcarbamoyltransferase complex dimerization subunit TsaB [Methylobacillus sp. MM3]
MKLLALDTSTEYLSLCLWQDGAMLSRDLLAGQKHSQLILPMLGEMLAEAGLTLPELDGIAFGAGPGSFTGLRIGCGVAQGLAFGANLPVVGVSTLLALAQQTDAERVIACLDARMGEVYHAAYVRHGSGWQIACEPGLYKPQDVPSIEGGAWFGIGSGWAAYGDILNACYAGQVDKCNGQAFPHARDIAALAANEFAAGKALPAAEAAPIYIRNKVALTMAER